MIVSTNKTFGAFRRTTSQAASIFLKKRAVLKKKVADYEAKVNKEYQPIVKEFLSTLPYKKGKVYELIENGHKRKGFKRFVIYTFDMQTFARSENPKKADMLMVRAYGWWLDEANNLPAKWDGHCVFGASNAAIFKLSDNQRNGKVPKHLIK